MCGISGIFGQEPSSQDLERMLEVVGRRGPEGQRTLSVESGIVGHCQLGFVRVGDNPQPLQEGKSWIVYNGEIYNWKELNKQYDFGARTDTEVLLKGLNKKGVEFLREIDGQFAFIARIDEKTVVGRDKYGISPIVFGKNKQGEVLVASTPEALSQVGVSDVKTVPAGAYGTITNDVKLDYWYTLKQIPVEDQKFILPKEIQADALASVITRIPDDKKTMYTTMGGIDSQFITATVSRATNGKFGGAVTVVPWDSHNPTNMALGDYHAAKSMVEDLSKEGIKLEHIVVQLTPEYISKSLDRVIRILGPDYFNICCGLVEDLVASTVASRGGKAILTAGGPDEAGRSYKPWTLMHKNNLEEGFHAINDQFSSSEGVRAGLVFGEHGIENRVPLAFLIEKMAYARPEQKQVIHNFGDGKDPNSIEMDDKILWRQAVKGLVSDYSLSIPKVTIHGATGSKDTLYYVACKDSTYQQNRSNFLTSATDLGWNKMILGPIDSSNKITEGQLYCLYRWSVLEQEQFAKGARSRYHVPKYSEKIDDKINRPICYDWLPR